MTTTDLDTRYGRTRQRGRRARGLAIAAAAAAGIAIAGWVVWVGPLAPGATIETRDLGFTTPDDDRLLLRFHVSAEPGSTVACALEARNAQHAVVGWRIVRLPASSARTRVFEEPIVTSEPADTGLISRCWLT